MRTDHDTSYGRPAQGGLEHCVNQVLDLESALRLRTSASYATHAVTGAMHALAAQIAAAQEAREPGEAAIREVIAPARQFIARSPFVARLQTWPRGYPGDFETVDQLVRQENKAADAGVGFYIEQWALTLPITQQHRNKLQEQARALVETALAKAEQGSRAAILSIACGAGHDLADALPVLCRSGARLVLNDVDSGALAICRERLGSLAGALACVAGHPMKKLRELVEQGPYDLVLTGGLFDYLADEQVASLLAQARTHLLAPGGSLLFTNIGKGNPYSGFMEYLADWRVIERDEAQLRRLAQRAGFAEDETEVTTEQLGVTFVVNVRRAAAGHA